MSEDGVKVVVTASELDKLDCYSYRGWEENGRIIIDCEMGEDRVYIDCYDDFCEIFCLGECSEIRKLDDP